MRILVTGGAGYIGATAVAMLLDAGYEVSVLDDLSTGHADALPEGVKFVNGSLLSNDDLENALDGCDAVMHFAAKSLVGTKNVSLSFAPSTSNDRLAGFSGEGKSMTSRMLDGTFPPYRHLLPTDASTTAVVEVAPFLDSVRRVALVTDKTVPLRLNFSNNTLQLEAGTGDEAQASEKLDINYKGEDINIAFNPTFLIDGLTAIGTAFVHISFTGANKPAVLTGQNEASGVPITNYKYLLIVYLFFH